MYKQDLKRDSALEVAKYEGVHVWTVFGIRGKRKEALSEPEVALKGTFEDKVLKSG